MLTDQIKADLKEALKNKDRNKLSVLRMLIASFNNEAIALKKKKKKV